MPILVVADEFPWPTVNGSRIRIANMVRGLLGVGHEVDLFCVCDPNEVDDRDASPRAGVARFEVVERSPIRRSWASMARWAVSRQPRELLWRDWSPARARLEAWARPQYDLVWFVDCDPFLSLGDLVSRPHLVEYDDLDSAKIAHRRKLAAAHRRRVVRDLVDLVDERRWRAIEARIAGRADRVVVCSEVDRQRLGEPNALVIPNGYEAPGSQVAPAPKGGEGPPVLLLIGLMTYPPNIDAASVLAREILPKVRTEVPGATLRLVGRTGPDVEALATEKGVVVVGPVPEVGPELAAASVVTVPVRFGGGTRIKILEAFAHRRPVVSTTVGCEGIDVEPGRHLLVADEPAAFADACVRLIRDDDLRRQLVDAAWDLYEERYRWDRIRPLVTEAAAQLIG